MEREVHWANVYRTKTPDQLSWHRPHLDTSLSLIERVAPDRNSRIIDAGAGDSTLIDDLIARGYRYLTALDISQTALDVMKRRLGAHASRVQWLVDDVITADLPANAYDVWHDRAVFHFLTAAGDRAAYVEKVRHSVRPGGYVITGTFGPDGPSKCSGLEVQRYDARALHREFGSGFRLLDRIDEVHRTPWGAVQQFVYCCCMVD